MTTLAFLAPAAKWAAGLLIISKAIPLMCCAAWNAASGVWPIWLAGPSARASRRGGADVGHRGPGGAGQAAGPRGPRSRAPQSRGRWPSRWTRPRPTRANCRPVPTFRISSLIPAIRVYSKYEEDPEARADFFGGIKARMPMVCALMQGPEEDYARGEQLAREFISRR